MLFDSPAWSDAVVVKLSPTFLVKMIVARRNKSTGPENQMMRQSLRGAAAPGLVRVVICPGSPRHLRDCI
eukprot:scaffold63745_cov20-Prasinocladus_malaysianus.AAC.1